MPESEGGDAEKGPEEEKKEEGGFKIPEASVGGEKKGKEKEVGVGNRKPDHKEGGEEGPKKAEKSKSFGPLYKNETDDYVYKSTRPKGSTEKTYASFLEGKASAELLSGSIDTEKKTAKLTLADVKAEGSVVHGQVDLVDKIKHLFGAADGSKPPPPVPTTPMAARVGDLTMHAGPLAPGPGSPNVLIGGRPAWRVGLDLHLCPAPGSPHGVGPASPGATTVLINGAPAARATDFIVEPSGGPDVIAIGCPTVFIGPAAPPPPPSSTKTADDQPWVIFESLASGDAVKGEAQLSAVATADLANRKGKLEAVVGGEVALLKGELPLKIRIRIPYTSYYLGLGVKVEGTLGSLGAEAGGGVKINDGKTFFEATGGAKAGAGIGGVGAKFGLDISQK